MVQGQEESRGPHTALSLPLVFLPSGLTVDTLENLSGGHSQVLLLAQQGVDSHNHYIKSLWEKTFKAFPSFTLEEISPLCSLYNPE